MKIKLPILDLREFTVLQQEIKVKEEFYEFLDEVIKYKMHQTQENYENKAEETFDLLQAVLGCLVNFGKNELNRISQKHYNKLQSRDRKIIGNINITVEVNENE
jgi:predicted acetyltransferase